MNIFGGKKDSLCVILKRKIVSAGIRTPIYGLRRELSTGELSDLLVSIKVAYTKYQTLAYKFSSTQLSQNDKL